MKAALSDQLASRDIEGNLIMMQCCTAFSLRDQMGYQTIDRKL